MWRCSGLCLDGSRLLQGLVLGPQALFMLMQLCLPCCLVLLPQEPVSSLRRKQERVLAVQLCAQNLEGGDRDEEDLTS